MEQKSEYFLALSASSRAKYERKVIAAGLTTDPYCNEQWHEYLDSLPEVNWSDMGLTIKNDHAHNIVIKLLPNPTLSLTLTVYPSATYS